MITSIPEKDILKLVQHQLDNMFMLSGEERIELEEVFPEVLDKLKYCFDKTVNKYYQKQLGGGKICLLQSVPFLPVYYFFIFLFQGGVC